MTTVSLQEFRLHPNKYLAATANGDVVLTQDGEPWVVLPAVDEDQDRLSGRLRQLTRIPADNPTAPKRARHPLGRG